MKTFKTTERMPEEPVLFFQTTGTQGGDAGHGGEASIGALLPSTGAHVHVKSSSGETLFDGMVYGEGTVYLTVFGDWELMGLEEAILELAEMIKQGGKS